MSDNNSSHAHEEHHHFEVVEEGLHVIHSSKKEIWKVFYIMVAITGLEFLVALSEPIKKALGNGMVVFIFLFLTILKAFYIVGYFMHLKHEKMNMGYTILLPFLFIIYLIGLLVLEGNYQFFTFTTM